MWIEMHSLMLLAAALLPWEQSLSWLVDLVTICASHLDAKSPEVDWWLRDTRPAFYIQQLKAGWKGGWQGRWWWGPRWQVRGWTGSSKIRPDIFPSQGLSEMSALDSCHQSVRAFLDTGDCPQKWQVNFFRWCGSCFFFCRWGAIYENHLKAKIMCVTS